MEILLHTPLDNRIVTMLLTEGGQKISELHQHLNCTETPVTLQAIYKRIRYLVASGIVLKNKQEVTISNEWAEEMVTLLGKVSSLPTLKSGESVAYSFKGLDSLDAYWKHIMLPLEKNLGDYPVFFYNPHEIWINLKNRQASEGKYLKEYEKNKRHCFYLLGKHNKFNASFKKDYQNNYVQVSINERSFSDRDYIAVIADYVITTRLSLSLTKKIDQAYMNPEAEYRDISTFATNPDSVKLKVERDEKKAKKIRSIIAKDFYIPKDLKEKYILF